MKIGLTLETDKENISQLCCSLAEQCIHYSETKICPIRGFTCPHKGIPCNEVGSFDWYKIIAKQNSEKETITNTNDEIINNIDLLNKQINELNQKLINTKQENRLANFEAKRIALKEEIYKANHLKPVTTYTNITGNTLLKALLCSRNGLY